MTPIKPNETPPPTTRVVPFSRAAGARAQVRRHATGDLLLDNAPYSRVYHAAVQDADGRFLYDLPAIAEPAGAIALAVDAQLRVALLRHWRPLPATSPPQDAFDFASSAVQRGFWSYEVPRGFPVQGEASADAARREAEEELGVRVSQVRDLGFCNANTSILLTDIPLHAVLAHPREPTRAERDVAERIAQVVWLSVDEALALVARAEVRCALTMGALLHLVASRGVLEEMVRGTS